MSKLVAVVVFVLMAVVIIGAKFYHLKDALDSHLRKPRSKGDDEE